MSPSLTRLYAVVFLSGFCSLVYQVTWLRFLRLIFGSSTTATAVVLAIFMGGLGLGGVLLGRRAAKARNPLALYASIEIGIALFAALSPLLVVLVRQFYLGVGGTSALGLWGATALRLLLAVLVLGVPTTLMGGTLPAVAQAMEKDSDRGRRIVASFYGVNTLGAVTGAFLTTFVLIELLGVRQSLWLAAAVNLLLGLGVRSMAQQEGEADAAPVSQESIAGAPDEKAAGMGGLRRPVVWIVLGAAFVVGFAFFLMELVWYRMLGPILGGTSYTFGLILSVALLGIGLGGWLFSRGAADRRPTLQALAATCSLEALFLIVPFALGDRLAYFALVLRALSAEGFTALVLAWTAVVSVVVLPAALVAGYQFPMLVALLGSGRRRVGPEVGLAYAWNTWGAITGSLAGGFLLLPLVSAPTLWRLSAVLLVASTAALLAAAFLTAPPQGAGAARRPGFLPVLGAALVLLFCLARGPSPFWRHSGIGAGRLDSLVTHDPNELRKSVLTVRRTVLKEAEGVESSVALRRGNDLALYVNGKSDGAVGDAPNMIMIAMVGAFLHPAPQTTLVIGLGTGMTGGWLAQVPEVERVDLVELEPSVAEMARYFAPMTFDVTELAKVRMIYGDGREHVRASTEGYDLIVSEPSNPYRAGVADLFSREFYEAVDARLRPGGIFAQWLQGYEVDPGVVGVAYATLHSVFPFIESWQIHHGDLLLVATREPLVHDTDQVAERAGREPYRSALRKTWFVDGLEGLYSGYLGNPGLARRVVDQGRSVSTDDRPLIEYGFARNMGRGGLFRITDLQDLARSAEADRPAYRGPEIDWRRVRELRQTRVAAGNFAGQWSGSELTPAERARLAARMAYGREELAEAAKAWASQPGAPVGLLDRLLIAEAWIETEDVRAEPAVRALRSEAPTEAELLLAALRWKAGDGAAAFEPLQRGLLALRSDPWAFAPLVLRALELVPRLAEERQEWGIRLFEILEEPFAVYRFDHVRRLKLVELVFEIGFAEHCVAAFEPFEPHVVWEEYFLAGRLACYEAAGHAREEAARSELEAFYANRPRPLYDSRQGLASGVSEDQQQLERLLEQSVAPTKSGH